MGRRSVLAVSLLVAGATAAPAQTGAPGGADMYGAAIVAFADSNHIPLSGIVIDTTRSGRVVMPGPAQGRPRAFPLADLRAVAKQLGFQLAGDVERFGLPGWSDTCSGCGAHRPEAAMIISGPKVTGDSAAVFVRWVRILPGYDRIGLQRFDFTRLRGVWKLSKTVVETTEVRKRSGQ